MCVKKGCASVVAPSLPQAKRKRPRRAMEKKRGERTSRCLMCPSLFSANRSRHATRRDRTRKNVTCGGRRSMEFDRGAPRRRDPRWM